MYIYLIGQTDSKFVKIGIANNLKLRLQSLQVGNPLKLFLIGAKEVVSKAMAHKKEKELHEKFKNHNLNGEWFYYTPEIEEEFKHNTLTAEEAFKDEDEHFRENIDKLPDIITAKEMKSKLLDVFGDASKEVRIPLKKYFKEYVIKPNGKSLKVYKKLDEFKAKTHLFSNPIEEKHSLFT